MPVTNISYGTNWLHRWEYDLVAAAYSINIHPHPRYLGQALADFVKKVAHPAFLEVWSKFSSLQGGLEKPGDHL